MKGRSKVGNSAIVGAHGCAQRDSAAPQLRDRLPRVQTHTANPPSAGAEDIMAVDAPTQKLRADDLRAAQAVYNAVAGGRAAEPALGRLGLPTPSLALSATSEPLDVPSRARSSVERVMLNVWFVRRREAPRNGGSWTASPLPEAC